jgi:hypothetical protein
MNSCHRKVHNCHQDRKQHNYSDFDDRPSNNNNGAVYKGSNPRGAVNDNPWLNM